MAEDWRRTGGGDGILTRRWNTGRDGLMAGLVKDWSGDKILTGRRSTGKELEDWQRDGILVRR